MAPTLYISAGSPAVRAVQITVKAIGLELNLKELDFMKGEHLQPEYLKVVPIIPFKNKSQSRFLAQPSTHCTHTGRQRRFYSVGQSRDQRLPRCKVRQERQPLPQGFEKEGAGRPKIALRLGSGFRQRSRDRCEYFCTSVLLEPGLCSFSLGRYF
jgi:hypothetical protein